MTTQTVVLRVALQLYPARYRRERGDELAAVFADTTAEAGRQALAREALDLAAYGLRVRTRLTSSSLGGRLLGAAAPLIAAAVAGASLSPWFSDVDAVAWNFAGETSLGRAIMIAQPVVALLLALAAMVGSWTVARIFAVGVVVTGLLGMRDAFAPEAMGWWWTLYTSTSVVPFVLSGLLVIAAPRDLLSRPTGWPRALMAASAVLGGLMVAAQGNYDTRYLMNAPWSTVLVVVPLFLVLTVVRGWLLPAAAGLAMLPLSAAFSVFSLWEETGGIWRLLPVGTAAVALMLAAVLVKRRRGGVPPGTEGWRTAI
ncbi:hypothetical protein [Kitasatospora sp. NPDC092286]|uniref:hypothetical protein n=1 Tax=Kitasatospora sp. NPDC092286 TaxID=3364087 RepID=UPI0037FBED1F